MRFRKILFILIFGCYMSSAVGQEMFLEGKVSDENGDPIGGATIAIRNTGIESSSDLNGFFRVSTNLGDSLQFTSIGFLDTIFVVKKMEFMNVLMTSGKKAIEVVTVNTGYQIIPKERAVGSFETIGSDKLQNTVSLNVLDKLEGQTTLLFDKDKNRPSITIRGINTFEGNTDPLIILDNFPYEGAVNSINPMDVESITILKDASAASIWGARASNGVVVINTKTGNNGQKRLIRFSSLAQIGNKPDLYYPNQIDSESLVELEKMMFDEGLYNSFENNTQRSWLSPVVELLIQNRDGTIDDDQLISSLEQYASTDNREQYLNMMYGNSLNQQYHLSYSQQTDKSNLYFSLGLDKNRGTLDDRVNRYNLRLNHAFRPNSKLEWSNTFMSSIIKQRNGYSGYPALDYHNRPYLTLVDDIGNELPHYTVNRHYAEEMLNNGSLLDWRKYPLREKDADMRHSSDIGLITSSAIKYRPSTWLDLSLVYRFEMDSGSILQLRGLDSHYTRNTINSFTSLEGGVPIRNIPLGAIKYDGFTEKYTHNWRGQINVQKQWRGHSLNALGGFEIRKRIESTLQTGVYGYQPETMTAGLVDYTKPTRHLLLGTDQFIPDPHSQRERRDNFVSGFFNAGYDFKKKYLITVSGRRDASNNFGMSTNDRWNPMWSLGAGWNVHEESFFENNFFDLLKVRTTYGLTGNMDPTKSVVTVLSFLGQDQYSQKPRAIVSQTANNELKWETTRTLNIGADFAFFLRRISGHIEYYHKWNENLFAPALNDLTKGVDRFSVRNVGNMRGQGIEANLNFSWIKANNLTLASNFLYNYNSYVVTSYLDNRDRISRNNISDGTNLLRIREGQPLYSIVSFPFDRLDGEGNLVSLLEGEPSTDYNAIFNADLDNLIYSGAATPLHFGNAVVSLSYKRFDINAIFSWKAKYNFRRPAVQYSMLVTQQPLGMGPGSGDFANRWRNPGDEAFTTIPRFEYPVGPSDNIYKSSEATVEDGAHIRFQTINMGYAFPSNQKHLYSDLKITFNIANVGLLWRKNKKNIDPDFPSSVTLSRLYSINIQLQF